MSLEIDRIDRVTPCVAEAFAHLLPQLAPTLRIPAPEELQAIAKSDNSAMFCAKLEGRIVGVLTLAWYAVPSGRKAWIEDVVVDATARGHGAGEALVRAAVEYAAKCGIEKVMLTSSEARQAAHALYLKIGFEVADTTLFRLNLEKL